MRLDSTSALEVSKSLLMIKSSNLQLGTTVGQGKIIEAMHTSYLSHGMGLYITLSGEFGIVYKAQLREGSSKGYSQTVAVKTLKGIFYWNAWWPIVINTIMLKDYCHGSSSSS